MISGCALFSSCPNSSKADAPLSCSGQTNLIFTTKDTKSTKKYLQNQPLWFSLALIFPFVSFVIFVVQAFRFCFFCLRAQ